MTQPLLRRVLKTALRPVYHPPRVAYQFVRASNIVRKYRANYEQARQLFLSTGHVDARLVSSLNDVGVTVLYRPTGRPVFDLPPNYDALLAPIQADVARRFERTDECLFMPPVDRRKLPAWTYDVPAVNSGDVISLQLRSPLDVEGLGAFASALLPALERAFYGSYVVVDKVYVYRNLASRAPEQVSWLWHYDNHPTEVLKLMIYLTDVKDDTAPFEYIRKAGGGGEPRLFTPYPLLGNSRVSNARVEAWMASGWERYKLVGPAGTLVLFDDNVCHKANIARSGHRDVLVLQLRPATFAPDHHIDARWTGSFEHVDFNPDPNEYAAVMKPVKFSA